MIDPHGRECGGDLLNQFNTVAEDQDDVALVGGAVADGSKGDCLAEATRSDE